MELKCIRCPKDKKKEAEFIYIGCSYCRDCYYIRREEMNELQKEHDKNIAEFKKNIKE